MFSFMMDNTWGSVAEEALNHSTSIKKYSKYKEANSLFINFALSSLASFNGEKQKFQRQSSEKIDFNQ